MIIETINDLIIAHQIREQTIWFVYEGAGVKDRNSLVISLTMDKDPTFQRFFEEGKIIFFTEHEDEELARALVKF